MEAVDVIENPGTVTGAARIQIAVIPILPGATSVTVAMKINLKALVVAAAEVDVVVTVEAVEEDSAVVVIGAEDLEVAEAAAVEGVVAMEAAVVAEAEMEADAMEGAQGLISHNIC